MRAAASTELGVLSRLYSIPFWNTGRKGSGRYVQNRADNIGRAARFFLNLTGTSLPRCPQIWEYRNYLLGLQQAGAIKVYREMSGGKGSQGENLKVDFLDQTLESVINKTLRERFLAEALPNRGTGFEPYDFDG